MRWKANAADVEIMFFFKDEPVYISSLVAEQIYHVLRFKDALSQQGILYHHFGGENKRGFEEVFRQSLMLYAKTRSRRGQTPEDGFRYLGEVGKILDK